MRLHLHHGGESLFSSSLPITYAQVQNGRIEEQGTYTNLIANGKEFSRLMQEFGGQSKEEEEEADAEEDIAAASAKPEAPGIDDAKIKSESVQRKGAGTGKLEGRLMVKERRTTGSVSWKGKFLYHSTAVPGFSHNVVYGDYLKAGKGYLTLPILVMFMVLMQSSAIMNSYTLVWWQAKYAASLFLPAARDQIFMRLRNHAASLTSRTPSIKSFTPVLASPKRSSHSACMSRIPSCAGRQ